MSDKQNETHFSPENAKVLIVDDVPKNIQMLGSTLRAEGYQIIPASSGEQALKAAEIHQPDLVLLDVMMPEMDGYEVFRRLHEDEATREIPVIFVTALADQEDETKGLEMGAVDYIAKPIKLPVALARVRTHLSLTFTRKKLAAQNEALIEAARLKEDIEHITRHDLKTPLSPIITVPKILKMEGGLTTEQLELIDMIEENGYRLLNMINLSLDLYKMEQGTYPLEPTAIDVVSIVRRVLEELKNMTRSRSIGLDILAQDVPASEDQVFEVKGEELLCYSMLANLIKNAIEASPDNSNITVSLNKGTPNAIGIHNFGAVPEDMRERFFDKYATSGKTTGTGLGTYSARLMAETQHGAIHLESNEKDGTTITIELP